MCLLVKITNLLSSCLKVSRDCPGLLGKTSVLRGTPRPVLTCLRAHLHPSPCAPDLHSPAAWKVSVRGLCVAYRSGPSSRLSLAFPCHPIVSTPRISLKPVSVQADYKIQHSSVAAEGAQTLPAACLKVTASGQRRWRGSSQPSPHPHPTLTDGLHRLQPPALGSPEAGGLRRDQKVPAASAQT